MQRASGIATPALVLAWANVPPGALLRGIDHALRLELAETASALVRRGTQLHSQTTATGSCSYGLCTCSFPLGTGLAVLSSERPRNRTCGPVAWRMHATLCSWAVTILPGPAGWPLAIWFAAASMFQWLAATVACTRAAVTPGPRILLMHSAVGCHYVGATAGIVA